MRICLAQINPTIGALQSNTDKIIAALDEARSLKADIVLFSELTIPGYPPEDLLLLNSFIDGCEQQLQRIIDASAGLALLVGTIRRSDGQKPLYNSAAVIDNGHLLGFVDKILLPTYDVFDEARYFEPGGQPQIWELAGKRVAITICEDIWTNGVTSYTRNPVAECLPHRPELFLNLTASPYSCQRHGARQAVLARAAKILGAPAFLCNQVGANDSLIFAGMSIAVNASGEPIARAKAFSEDLMLVDSFDSHPLPDIDPMEELFEALSLGVHDYFIKSGFSQALLGLSGGIDSALVAAIAVKALGRENVLGVSMPSRFSTQHGIEDAEQLAKNLGIELKTIPIESVFTEYLELLTPHFEGKPADVTEENLQARIRGQILMALSNKHGHIVLATGNKSEMAMGYATLYGDMCGGLGVINDLSKNQLYELCRWLGPLIPKRILNKPPSAELAPDQKDADSLPDYSVVDAVLDDYVVGHQTPQAIAANRSIPEATVRDLIRRIHRNEYKRRQAPPGLRVSERAFSVGRRFPIVHHWVP